MSYPQTTFQNVKFESGGFWYQKRRDISTVALHYQLKVLKDTGRYDAFKLRWHPIYDDAPEIWPVPKHLFWDSDVAKWIEGACYFLREQDDAVVRLSVEELVDMIAAAQQPDGYLNIHFTVVEPSKRFSNLRDLHELYNAGHLIEGALAHEQVFGNDKLLKPIIRYVDLLDKTFGLDKGQKPGYPGHPEIELALLRLYDRTKDSKHLRLARYFITERGNPKGIEDQHYYEYEERIRGDTRVPDYFPEPKSYWYQQAHQPIIDQQTVEGHSVRAMYLLTALADLLRIDPQNVEKSYDIALHRLWDNMVHKKMYLTGGIGAVKQWEGFSYDYFLPQGTHEGGCYAETCASIGVMMLAERLLQIDLKGHYADIMELALYNAVLTGVSCSGKEWTYVNQLASSETDPSRRSDWFTVACCPPNVLRLLGDLGGYIYNAAVDEGARKLAVTLLLFANVTITETVAGKSVSVRVKTIWPLNGNVEVEVHSPEDIEVELLIRVPGWSASAWKTHPSNAQAKPSNGFLKIDKTYLTENATFSIEFDMKPQLIKPSPMSGQNIAAIMRGPLIYCLEDVDNGWVQDHFRHTVIHTRDIQFEEKTVADSSTGEEYVQITAPKAGSQADEEAPGANMPFALVSEKLKETREARKDLVFVPYYFRANRAGRGHMRTGLRIAS